VKTDTARHIIKNSKKFGAPSSEKDFISSYAVLTVAGAKLSKRNVGKNQQKKKKVFGTKKLRKASFPLKV